MPQGEAFQRLRVGRAVPMNLSAIDARYPARGSSRRALRLVLLVLRLDRVARGLPLGVAPLEELVEGAAVHEVRAAVDRDGLAGEEFALVGHEEGGEVLKLGHFAGAVHGVHRDRLVAEVAAGREALAGALGGEDARGDRVQADAVAPPFDGERL